VLIFYFVNNLNLIIRELSEAISSKIIRGYIDFSEWTHGS